MELRVITSGVCLKNTLFKPFFSGHRVEDCKALDQRFYTVLIYLFFRGSVHLLHPLLPSLLKFHCLIDIYIDIMPTVIIEDKIKTILTKRMLSVPTRYFFSLKKKMVNLFTSL